jgi:glutamate-ammonia-ligase adenylyltransferase
VVVCDQIDRRNVSHVAFYDGVVDELIALVCDDSQPLGINLDLREQPRIGSARVLGIEEAVEYYESTNRIWQRMNFVKARVAAGSSSLGATFLGRLQPWIYRAFMNRAELGEIRALRHKLERRAERSDSPGDDVRNDPGGRRDVEMAIQFLQLLHGNELSSVRVTNTHDAIDALQQAGCVTHQEATLLSGNYARLCRLQHQHSVMFQLGSSRLPADRKLRRRLAWRLGLRTADGQRGDLERFEDSLRETFRVNRRIINHLMVDTPHGEEEPPIETELLLDPSPDRALVESTLSRYGLADPARAMTDLAALGTESVSFLSQPRCRHFLAILAPTLLNEIAQTPSPDKTLTSLVEVTESLGAKAVLWELFRTNPPTMKLMVRLCAAAPYLSGILVNHPGMIDELIDSLLMDTLPSANRLDAQSIELCRAAEDLGPILKSFKNCAHLTVGVRDILGRDSIESTHRALSDTAEACLRRVVEHEQARLASRFGDPMTAAGEPAHLVVVALGKLGGREPNYHSTLDVVFLYTDDGETRRRIGGPRATATNKYFFHQLAQNVLGRVYAYGPLYELDSRLRISGGEETLCASVEAFVRRFRHGIAPLWERMALCKARCVVGPRPLRQRIDASLVDLVRGSTWHDRMSEEIRDLRQRIEEASTSTNLKRGAGGTLDVEMIAQMLTLKNASNPDLDIRTSTTESLQGLADAGCIDEEQALTLIGNYRVLRRIEANLRLMDTPERHRLPDEPEALRDLAFLMNERDPAMILAQCQQAQRTNRRIFDVLTGCRDG